MGRPIFQVKDQIRIKTDRKSGCWNWTGKIASNGYGHMSFNMGTHLAHRKSYEAFVGPIHKGLVIDHLCKNKRCVNPSHLEAVSQRENVLRSDNACGINSRKTKCSKAGHPLSGDNLYVSKPGYRSCRTCARIGSRKRKAC